MVAEWGLPSAELEELKGTVPMRVSRGLVQALVKSGTPYTRHR